MYINTYIHIYIYTYTHKHTHTLIYYSMGFQSFFKLSIISALLRHIICLKSNDYYYF